MIYHVLYAAVQKFGISKEMFCSARTSHSKDFSTSSKCCSFELSYNQGIL